jgi:hypothetical protein
MAPCTGKNRVARCPDVAYRSISSLTMKAPAFAALSLLLCSVSCDKHSWDSTQVLHEGMHKAHGEAHGDNHGKDAHGKSAEGHGDKAAKPH